VANLSGAKRDNDAFTAVRDPDDRRRISPLIASSEEGGCRVNERVWASRDDDSWRDFLRTRYPITLGRDVSEPGVETWGESCPRGWRDVFVRLMDRLEALAASEPIDVRSRYRIGDLKQKFGVLTVRLEGEATEGMRDAIHAAENQSSDICEMCGAPGVLAPRGPTGWMSPRCVAHETWTRFDGLA
jgi:hypothetical protein